MEEVNTKGSSILNVLGELENLLDLKLVKPETVPNLGTPLELPSKKEYHADPVIEGKIIYNISTKKNRRKSRDCDVCMYKTTSHVDLKTQQMNEHNHVFSGEYSCKLCKFASTNAGIKEHSKRYHALIQCEHCSFKFSTKKSLKLHIHKGHKNLFPGDFSCKFCNYTSTKAGVVVHVYREHKDKNTLSCDSCSFMSHTRGSITEHQVNEHGFASSIKENDDLDKGQARRGWISKLPQVRKKQVRKKQINDYQSCRLCDFSDTFRILAKHYNEKHEGSKHYTCSLCDYTTNIKGQLRKHNDAIHLGKVFHCDQCEFKTSWQSYLKLHVNSTHLKSPLSCSQCDYKNPWKISVSKHERIVHNIRKHKFSKKVLGSKESQGRKIKPKESNRKSNYEENLCVQCGFKTKFSEYLESHRCQLTEVFKCDKCPFKTKLSENFKVHQTKGHDNQYNCDICDYFSFQKVTLIAHVKRIHATNTKLTCDNCDYSAERGHQLLYHNQKFHSQNICKECGKEEKNKYFLNLHIQKMHVSTTISCNRCNFKDDSLYQVEKHAKLVHPEDFC